MRWLQSDGVSEIVTTSRVLIELANFMTLPHERQMAAAFISDLKCGSAIRIVPASEELLWRGFDLYRDRPDKAWSLTDCTSFIVMREEELSEAFTGDRHFEQAGFIRLLAQD